MTENLERSKYGQAVDIPIIADLDTGYGNALNVIRTVREFEEPGVGGILEPIIPQTMPGGFFQAGSSS
jgi:2-methylisocitrate lyase-like PEP mutase family enzyme